MNQKEKSFLVFKEATKKLHVKVNPFPTDFPEHWLKKYLKTDEK